ncbi:hypothetical protein [Hymenobacter wooponensis]|uniref:Uncharacterized protein n=1 Tax=Hymenobacter wooponensis TaxID=1525360 RepID=A0A4Z0MDJ4_9BACT|nr:hypothetical protein [Hymenobacter wooponensis]TGD77564.1 hypothetical protein EU557_22560 [Hymenobacter wooponensis]
MKPLKQALVTELTAALAAILPPAAGTLPKGVAHALDDLADSILRWRASQQRPARSFPGKTGSSESDALARLMDSRLHEEEEPALAPEAPVALPERSGQERKRRPRLGAGR